LGFVERGQLSQLTGFRG